ncbi:MAG: hypothetical protein ACLP29_02230 [Dissulfurispiraceae bacterium]
MSSSIYYPPGDIGQFIRAPNNYSRDINGVDKACATMSIESSMDIVVYLWMIFRNHDLQGSAGRKNRGNLLALLLIISVISMSCSLEPSQKSIDKNKFAKLNAAAVSVKASIDAGESYQQAVDKADILSGEITAMKDAVATKRESRLLKAYSDLLTIYRDGLLLWRYQEYFPHLAPELKGSIYVAQDVEPIVEKYRFSTESHIYKPTGQKWKSIPADSIRIVWKNADDQLAIIKNITDY